MSDHGKGSFWTTLPGVLTGIAAIITALAGLFTALYATGQLPLPSPDPGPPKPEISSTIAFESDRNGEYAIFSMKMNGSDLRTIIDEDSVDIWPAYSPDGQMIAFSRFSSTDLAGGGSLYVLDLNSYQLTLLVETDAHRASWSPDGEWIAFDAYTGGLQLIRPDGTDRWTCVNDTFADRPSSTPDSQNLVYHVTIPNPEKGAPDSGGLFITSIDPGARDCSTRPNAILEFGFSPSVSPDSQKLAFVSNHAREFYDVYVANMDGTSTKNLTIHSESNNFNPIWSSTGGQIVFVSNREGNDEIYEMNIDGKNLINVSNRPDSDESGPNLLKSRDS